MTSGPLTSNFSDARGSWPRGLSSLDRVPVGFRDSTQYAAILWAVLGHEMAMPKGYFSTGNNQYRLNLTYNITKVHLG